MVLEVAIAGVRAGIGEAGAPRIAITGPEAGGKPTRRYPDGRISGRTVILRAMYGVGRIVAVFVFPAIHVRHTTCRACDCC